MGATIFGRVFALADTGPDPNPNPDETNGSPHIVVGRRREGRGV